MTNGLGGYASGTVAGVATRRYHGLLIAALPAPLGRTMMLNHLAEQLRLPDGTIVRFGGAEWADRRAGAARDRPPARIPPGQGLPVWRYEVDGFVLEKRVLLRLSAEHRPRHTTAWSTATGRCG